MFEHSHALEGAGHLGTSSLSAGHLGTGHLGTSSLGDGVTLRYHAGVGTPQHSMKRRMPRLRDMSYEDLPASDTYRLLPDVCDAAGAGGGDRGDDASDGDGAQLRVRPAQYGGSFTVAGTDQSARSEYVRSTIHKLQVPTAGTKPVLLIVSLEGIKVCGPEGKEIYMSHALRRISYATCDPSRGQFSFLAREPRGHLNLQYCHTFFTGSADKAEELNTIVGNAFRMAYAARLQRSCIRPSSTGSDPAAWDPDNRNNHDKTNNRTWGRRSKHHRDSSRRDLARGKNVNLTSSTASPVEVPEPATPASSRLSGEPRCPLLTGYVNEAVSTTDSESRSSESDGRPLSAGARSVSASSQSLREDTKSCHWSSASSSVSAPAADGTSGTTSPSPPYYQQGPSREAVELRAAAWFQAGIPREIALEVLSQEPVGAFMVRESTTKHGCYALSLRVPRDFQVSGIAHYLILKTAKGYKIKGFMKEFTSLTALITHHSVMPELLPCTLSLSRYNPNFARSESAQDLVELTDTDSEYNGLSELSRATADTSV